MASYVPVFFLVAFLLCCSPTSGAFNITDIFDQLGSPGFNVFNSYLTQTLVAGDINSRQTITVLAVDNPAISALSGLPLDVIRNVLSVHVILDYFDVAKFQSLNNGTGLLVTMFQATGLATGQMGFLNATDFPGGAVALGSAVPGAGLNANLVRSLFEQPYNISVLQVSSVIIPPGIQNLAHPSPPPPPPPPPPPAAAPIPSAAPPKSAQAPKKAPSATPTPAPAPKAAPSPKKAPSGAPTPAATPSAPAPTSKGAPAAAPAAPSPSPSKPASPPAPAAAQPPTSSAPQSPLPSAPAEAPAAADTPSWGTRVVTSTGLAAAAALGAALLFAF